MKRLLIVAALLAASPLRAQEPARVYELEEVDARPVPRNVAELRLALEASYPPEKRAAGVGARVFVELVVGEDGVPRAVRVTQSEDAAFDSATLAGVSLLRFQPGTAGGRPVAVRVELPIEWKIPEAVAEAPAPRVPEADFTGTGEGLRTDASGARTYEAREVEDRPALLNPQELAQQLQRLYPPELRQARVRGGVQVRILVTRDGRVEEARIVHSTDSRLDAASIRAISGLRFRPGRVGGRPVPTWIVLPIDWRVR